MVLAASFLAPLDWAIIAAYCLAILVIGFLLKKKADKSTESFFLSDRSMPWWLAGTSMVATSFASDTPLFVTGIVRGQGVAGNWSWWCFGIAHVLAVMFFAKFWRRAQVTTEVEFCELRYDGKGAAVLRGTKALYFGLMLNVLVIGAWPLLGLNKVMEVSTGWSKGHAIVICGGIALLYSVFSGFWGVVITDLIQFVIAMAGALILMFYVLGHPDVGGFAGIKEAFAGTGKTDFIPEWGSDAWWLVMGFILVQWWAFKNADGGGVIVQRMSACKDEKESMKATLWFTVAHYILRCWPWVIVALGSLLILPTMADGEMAYPQLMMDLLPVGLKGLLVASFLAAFMSTVDTHLNWGSSYLVNDLYKRFVNTDAEDKHYLLVSRGISVGLMILAAGVAFASDSILGAFYFMLKFTAGVGIVYLLRWFWWRVNAWTELTAMVTSAVMAVTWIPTAATDGGKFFGFIGESTSYFTPAHIIAGWVSWSGRTAELVIVVLMSAIVAVIGTLLTRPVNEARLISFYRRVRPPGWGWSKIAALASEDGRPEPLIPDLVNWALGVAFLYSGLYGVGAVFLIDVMRGMLAISFSIVTFIILWRRLFPGEPQTEAQAVGGALPAVEYRSQQD
jgi:Na+/proline symporter